MGFSSGASQRGRRWASRIMATMTAPMSWMVAGALPACRARRSTLRQCSSSQSTNETSPMTGTTWKPGVCLADSWWAVLAAGVVAATNDAAAVGLGEAAPDAVEDGGVEGVGGAIVSDGTGPAHGECEAGVVFVVGEEVTGGQAGAD